MQDDVLVALLKVAVFCKFEDSQPGACLQKIQRKRNSRRGRRGRQGRDRQPTNDVIDCSPSSAITSFIAFRQQHVIGVLQLAYVGRKLLLSFRSQFTDLRSLIVAYFVSYYTLLCIFSIQRIIQDSSFLYSINVHAKH